MIKKLFYLVAIIFTTSTAFAEEHKSLYCAPELQETLSLMRELPEADEVLTHVLDDGPLSIKVDLEATGQFEATWNATRRTIFINKDKNSSKGTLLVSLLFELHNAHRDDVYYSIYKKGEEGKLSQKEYVRAVEFYEYENALATSKLLKKGIKQGIYPESARWHISNNFEEHFQIQQSSGHSSYIAKEYNHFSKRHQLSS